ncbi:MAG: uridine kinase [Bacteroidales bacterium]|nr:uridine kinase [Bacteroidales bacterium]
MLIIGIAGGTGSGKSTVVRQIVARLGEGRVSVVSQDAYYYDSSHLPLEERRKKNFDHPSSIEFPLLAQHIRDLRAGKTIQQPTYSYITCSRLAETIEIQPTEVVIVEGILILGNDELRKEIDIKVYVDADDDDRLARVIQRDMAERGRDAQMTLDRYAKTVKPSHLQFVEPTKRFADIIIPQGGMNQVAIDILAKYINSHLKD